MYTVKIAVKEYWQILSVTLADIRVAIANSIIKYKESSLLEKLYKSHSNQAVYTQTLEYTILWIFLGFIQLISDSYKRERETEESSKGLVHRY